MTAKNPLLFLILLTYCSNVTNGGQPNYIDAERTAIDKLRPLIADYLVPDYMKTDVYHLRLLKATKFDVEKAVEMVKRNRKWRISNNVDEILNEDLNAYFSDIPMKVEGVDREGSPIMQIYFGNWKLRKYALSGDQKLWKIPVRIHIHALESAEQRLYEIQKSGGQNISSVYVLTDIDGYSFKQHVCPQCLSILAEIMRSFLHYPSFLKKDIMLNAPNMFARLNDLMKATLPSEATQTFQIYTPDNNKWRDEVSKDVSPDQLPKDFGGTKDNWYKKN